MKTALPWAEPPGRGPATRHAGIQAALYGTATYRVSQLQRHKVRAAVKKPAPPVGALCPKVAVARHPQRHKAPWAAAQHG